MWELPSGAVSEQQRGEVWDPGFLCCLALLSAPFTGLPPPVFQMWMNAEKDQPHAIISARMCVALFIAGVSRASPWGQTNEAVCRTDQGQE